MYHINNFNNGILKNVVEPRIGLLRNLENLEKSGNWIFHQKIKEFRHFIQKPGKVREFEKNLRLEMIFMPTLKPKSNISVVLNKNFS